MTDRPIIFSAPMVRALLDGRKSQTRRVLKPQPEVGPLSSEHLEDHEIRGWLDIPLGADWATIKRIPYAPGDRLYVREAHKLIDRHCDYRADWPEGNQHLFTWRPSIHMPRWASRITLTVTEVRVQRLQEISEADAVAEGVEPLHTGFFPYGITTFLTTFVGDREVPAQCCRTARHSYEMLWNSLHGPDAWDANPWIVAVRFTTRKGNIDAPSAESASAARGEEG